MGLEFERYKDFLVESNINTNADISLNVSEVVTFVCEGEGKVTTRLMPYSKGTSIANLQIKPVSTPFDRGFIHSVNLITYWLINESDYKDNFYTTPIQGSYGLDGENPIIIVPKTNINFKAGQFIELAGDSVLIISVEDYVANSLKLTLLSPMPHWENLTNFNIVVAKKSHELEDVIRRFLVPYNSWFKIIYLNK